MAGPERARAAPRREDAKRVCAAQPGELSAFSGSVGRVQQRRAAVHGAVARAVDGRGDQQGSGALFRQGADEEVFWPDEPADIAAPEPGQRLPDAALGARLQHLRRPPVPRHVPDLVGNQGQGAGEGRGGRAARQGDGEGGATAGHRQDQQVLSRAGHRQDLIQEQVGSQGGTQGLCGRAKPGQLPGHVPYSAADDAHRGFGRQGLFEGAVHDQARADDDDCVGRQRA